MDKGTVYFFTGLSGAGKTTIGGLFHRRLKARKSNVVLLDGDLIRLVYCEDIGYSDAGRRRGAFRSFRVCKMLSDQGIDVVLCSIAMYNDCRAWAREHIENYREIYVKAAWETLYHRDQKGLYSSGMKNVVGVDILCEEPEQSDVVIENDGQEAPEKIVDRLEAFFGLNG